MPKPQPKPAAVPEPDEEDDYQPGSGAPQPSSKAPNGHPVRGDEVSKKQGGEVSRSQGANTSREGQRDLVGASTSRHQGGTEPGTRSTRLSSVERPKLGARVDPWLKKTLKIAAAIEGRKEEALVEQALTAYLWQHHPQLAAQHAEGHERPASV